MVSEKIVSWMIESKSISETEKDIYLYGIRLSMALVANIVASLVIGILFDMVFESILFLLLFLPLRMNAGGIHAATYMRCFVISCLLLFGILVMVKYISVGNNGYIAIITLSAAVIGWLSPVEDTNKPLEEIEKKIYGQRTRRLLLFYVVLAWILYFFEYGKCLRIEAVSLHVVAWILVFGIIKNTFLLNKRT